MVFSLTFFRRVTTHGGGNMSSVAPAVIRAGLHSLRWAAPVAAAAAAARGAAAGDSAEASGGHGEPGTEVAASPSETENRENGLE